MAKKNAKSKSRLEVVKSTVSGWGESVKDRASAANDKWVELQEDTRDLIAENPMSATLVAFGVGVMAGVLLTKLLEKKDD